MVEEEAEAEEVARSSSIMTAKNIARQSTTSRARPWASMILEDTMIPTILTARVCQASFQVQIAPTSLQPPSRAKKAYQFKSR